MFERFFPDEWVESAYSIDYEGYFEAGYRGLIFDIDNTLVPHGADADERAIKLFERLKEIGFDICLLSNNKKPRVERFNKDINVKYIFKAGKPYSKNYYVASMMTRTSTKSTLVIGDQLFTDIYGGKLAGIHTILVNPIDKKEDLQVRLKRLLERPVMMFYKHSLKEMAAQMPRNRKPETKASRRFFKKRGKHFSVSEHRARIDRLFKSRYI
ncbi:MAG: YqeG family HAD IIIA-type phosphatase [Lachnospiraceae bacterium]|nr:YqeG family HAD IIIA-type phosphatase [Lachnospiraceae bacterium]